MMSEHCPRCGIQVLLRMEHYDGFGNGVECEWGRPQEICDNCGLKVFQKFDHWRTPMFFRGKFNLNHVGGRWRCTKQGTLRKGEI